MIKHFLLFAGLLISIQVIAQTGIGTSTPNASAKLDVSSSTLGFLPPRVTLTAANTFSPIVGTSSAATGLLVYNLGSVGLQAGYYYWNGANWATIATATSAGNGVTSMDMVKLYGEAHSKTSGKIGNSTTGYAFTVPVSGRYLFDFTSSATALNGGTNTIYFTVRQGTTVLGSDNQSSYNNNVHVEYNGKVEVNLQAGVNYNVYNYATSGSFEGNDYDRVYYKLVAGNLPVTGQSVDYIQSSLSANQALSAVGNINFSTSSGTGITITSGGFNLIANKTYKLEAAIGGASGGYAYYGWVDNSNNLLPGGSIGAVIKAGNDHTDAPQDKAVVYFTPTVDTRVFLRVYNLSGTLTAYAPSLSTNFSSTWASIQQVGSSAIINPWTLSGTNTFNTTGNVGIGTTSPNASAILDISSTTKGITFPRMTTTQRNAISSPTTGLQVFDNTTNSIWYYDGSTWVNSVSVASFGDVKTGFQSGDHNGWIRLNGRAKSTLSTTQQTQATALGIGDNLPDATNAVLMQSSGTLGTLAGSMSMTLAQNQLPNITPSISVNNTTATMQNAGAHEHPVKVVPNATGGYASVNPSAFKNGVFPSPMNESYSDITDRVNSASLINTGIIGSAGSHSHVIDAHNHTATSTSINGGVTQQSIDITPRRLVVNTFIYLGN
jgi:hypothetical protein